MPIYEFYCDHCHAIFNFYSRTINTTKRPDCPRCRSRKLSRQMSTFSVIGRTGEGGEIDDPVFDEGKMAQAIQMVAGEADKIDADDPKQAAQLMRKLSRLTDLEPGDGLEEALSRMEDGQVPEQIEAELGDVLETEDPFRSGKKSARRAQRRSVPKRDDRLYDL